MKYVIMLFSLVFFLACEPEEHFPDVNAYRDAELIGTWRIKDASSKDSTFYVFTSHGYTGSTSYINNAQIKGFTNLTEIWHNIEGIADDGWGKIYLADGSSSWTMKRNVNEKYYKLTESKDTLYLASVSLKTKQANKDKPSVFVKNRYQLIFDGPKYVGIDSIK